MCQNSPTAISISKFSQGRNPWIPDKKERSRGWEAVFIPDIFQKGIPSPRKKTYNSPKNGCQSV